MTKLDPSSLIGSVEIPPDPLPGAIAWSRENLIGAAEIPRRSPGADPARFNVLSLPAWLAVAQRAGVPFIPAREIARMDALAFSEAGHQDAAGDDALDRFEAEIISRLGDGILRFEQVAPAEIKSARSSGDEMNNGTFYSEPLGRQIVHIFEDRFYTTLTDLGHPEILALARPRVETVDISGTFRGQSGDWPVEFRVFVQNGEVTGISNYYPQIALDPEIHRAAAGEALEAARMICATMQDLRLGVGNHRLCPNSGEAQARADWIPGNWGPQDYTLDFLLAASSGRTLFLEGGPAGIQAAHPCCFVSRLDQENPLHGVAWSADDEPRPLSSLA